MYCNSIGVNSRYTGRRYYCTAFTRNTSYMFKKSCFTSACLTGQKNRTVSIIYKIGGELKNDVIAIGHHAHRFSIIKLSKILKLLRSPIEKARHIMLYNK